jgi:hypothetical protein
MVLCIPVVFSCPGIGQSATPANPGASTIQLNQRQSTPFGDLAPNNDPGFAEKRFRALNAQRQKELVSDAEKLLKLARELDAEIAKNRSEGLTSEEMHKLAAIEKLAKSVKQKMILSWGGGPEFHMPNLPPQAQLSTPR